MTFLLHLPKAVKTVKAKPLPTASSHCPVMMRPSAARKKKLATYTFVTVTPRHSIKLNDSAGAIGQHIDGQQNVADIVALLKQQFGDIAEIEQDVVDYMRVAQQQYWIDLR